ncbi:MAG: translocation/assembly module TamB [Bacteroidales bacterium]|nr:translocation/assembly module TamB [Bacteroidales bacterium]
MVVLSVFVSLFIAIQDPIIQKFAVRVASGYLSENLGVEFKIGRLYISPDLNVILEDVLAKDQKDNVLLSSDKISAQFFYSDAFEGDLHLGKVELDRTEANLVTYEGEDVMNLQFIIDFFSSDKEREPKEGSLPIRIDRLLLKDVDFMLWNQNRSNSLKTQQHAMDYAHIDVDDINLDAYDVLINGDSISASIKSLTANELSGFELKAFKTDALVCSKGIFLDGLKISTNNSQLDLDLHMLYNDFEDISYFVDSVRFDARIHPTDILLSDIGVFAPVMYKMPDRLLFEALFTGPIEHFTVDSLVCDFGNITHLEGKLTMHPLDFENGFHTLNISKMLFSYDDLANFGIPGRTGTIPLPESLKPMTRGSLRLDFNGSYVNFDSKIDLKSNIGNVNANIGRVCDEDGNNKFAGFVNVERVDVGKLANIEKTVGALDLAANVSMNFPKKGKAKFDVDGNVYRVDLLGNFIDRIKVDGSLNEDRFNGKLSVFDNDLDLDFVGLIDFENRKKPKSDFTAVIRNADLAGLNILKNDSISNLSTHLTVKMTGFDIDDLEGTLNITNTLFKNSRGEYAMDNFTASIVNDNLIMRRINMDCDFFNLEMAGQMNLNSLPNSLKEHFDYYVEVPLWDQQLEKFMNYRVKHNADQDFYMNMTLKDTHELTRLLLPNLTVAKNTTLNGTFTSRSHLLNFTMRSKQIDYGSVRLENVELKKHPVIDGSASTLSINKIVWRDSTSVDTTVFGLDRFTYDVLLKNDTIFNTLSWNDLSDADHNKALVNGCCVPNDLGASFWIRQADLTINDSVWCINPKNYIEVANKRIKISNLEFCHNQQRLMADGVVPKTDGDTINVSFNKFDVSNFDLLFRTMGFDADGFISGNAWMGRENEKPVVDAQLVINDLGMNNDYIGDAHVDSHWDNDEKAINVDVGIENQGRKTLDILGTYFLEKEDDNLDFAIKMDSLQLGLISPFVTGLVSRLQGTGVGEILVSGTPQKPSINGKLGIRNGGCKIDYLNSFFTFEPNIDIDSKSIVLNDMVLVDTLGNKAYVDGKIMHSNFKNFVFDITIIPMNFMAMATTLNENESFYGTAVADGLVKIKGPLEKIALDIKAKTRKGTKIVLPLNGTSTVSDIDYVTFISHDDIESENKEETAKPKKNFSLQLDADVTDDASVRIILPGNIGTIEASGNGNIKLGTSTSSSLSLIGEFVISDGEFVLNFKNLLNKNFKLKKGGSITWTGEPTKGRIDATGSYTVKASLASLGIANTVTNVNVDAECLIHLKDALLNPTISFGLRLPKASDDTKQTVYSLLDTTNQSVMSTQVLSLLLLGTFSNAGVDSKGNSSTSLLSSLTSQLLSGWMSEISRDFNFGLKYHAADGVSNEEWQVELKTELFNNRLIIESNFGVVTAYGAGSNYVSNIVGEVDLYYKLSKDGRLMGHFYNHSNNNTNFSSYSFDRIAPYTQGLGVSYSRSFDKFKDLFKKKNSSAVIVKPKNNKP